MEIGSTAVVGRAVDKLLGAVPEWVASTLAISSCTKMCKTSWSKEPPPPEPVGAVELEPVAEKPELPWVLLMLLIVSLEVSWN